jgi:protein-L-isoaspartate(D-aspartate) O-methyltransferase
MPADEFEVQRRHMLAEISAATAHVSQLIGKSALDERVIAAMAKIPRHEFVPLELRPFAYGNMPLPIGFNKTISQPFMVAFMTDLLAISAHDAVLEIGTGLGYQAAILAQLAREVYSIELIEELGQQAKLRLRRQGCSNIKLKIANGYHGWSEHAPFDHGDRGSRPRSPTADPAVEKRGEDGGSRRPVRCAAARACRQRLQRQSDDAPNSAGAVLATRGGRNGLRHV